MEENNKKEQITRTDLEEQTQVLLSALDSRFNSMEKRITGVMDIRFNAVGNRIDGLDSRMDGLEKKIDDLQTSVDGLVKKQVDFEDEHIIIKEEVKQMKTAFKDKLGVVIKAV